jgi:hypothetical protein
MPDTRRSRAFRPSRSSRVQRRLAILDEACAELNPVLAFVAIGLALNLCFCAFADPELVYRGFFGLRLSDYEE